jgi:hypothetical protein
MYTRLIITNIQIGEIYGFDVFKGVDGDFFTSYIKYLFHFSDGSCIYFSFQKCFHEIEISICHLLIQRCFKTLTELHELRCYFFFFFCYRR